MSFFENSIEGFSVEEHISPECWYNNLGDSMWPAWEWKGAIIREIGCAYGKFFEKKACYISPKWFHDFANYRRDGYDFDARYDDGLVPYRDKQLYDLVEGKTYMVLADGNYALAVSEGTFGGTHTSYYDLFRVENGKIAEHWDVMETIADKETWANGNGKF